MSNRKKRPNGDGSIYQTADGRWRAVVSLGASDGKRKRRSRLCITREDARLALRDLHAAGPLKPSDAMTVGEYMTAWLDGHVAETKAKSTAYGYRFAWERHLAPNLATLNLRKLTALQVEHAVRQVDAGDQTRRHAFKTLSSAFGRAAKLELLPRNPCELLDMPRCRKASIEAFSLDEVRRLIEASAKKRLGGVVVLALTVGLRQGELFGLQWGDVDWTAGTLRIARQAREVAGCVEVVEPKTAAGIRTVALPQVAVDALRERRSLANAAGLAKCPWIFPGRGGKPMLRSNFGHRHWRPLLKELGIRHRGLHHARHTAASLLLGGSVPVHIVSRMLGHASPSITLDVYAHLMPHQTGAAADAMSRLLG